MCFLALPIARTPATARAHPRSYTHATPAPLLPTLAPSMIFISQAKHAFEQLREEIRNKNLEEINMLRISLDAQIEELEQHFETAHLNYLQQTAQRTHDFKELTHKDQKLDVEINQKKKKIDNLQASIKHWRSKMRVLSRETEERNRLLLEEKNSIQQHYQQLKQRIKIYRHDGWWLAPSCAVVGIALIIILSARAYTDTLSYQLNLTWLIPNSLIPSYLSLYFYSI